mgnify:CR=1 FL=1
MMQKRMETLMQKLPAGTDAALIQSDVNRRYLTGNSALLPRWGVSDY